MNPQFYGVFFSVFWSSISWSGGVLSVLVACDFNQIASYCCETIDK
ncbi:hypothetical protein OIU79_009818 [Salix purpurea]|uniref:Uncharacterized protein n=1 Tax=Salix purpurea TaxID=77065 RepID=A0A9Q0QF73_SALPP|nr:hypothetical protein OIU79_009818 [Salix purpurea]